MAKAKKTSTENKVEARPIHHGKDPLADGNKLRNPTNTEAETHYEVEERGEDVMAQNRINGKDANQRAEEHNAQEPVDTEDAMREKAQELHREVTNRTEEEQAEESAQREEALAKDPEVKSKLK